MIARRSPSRVTLLLACVVGLITHCWGQAAHRPSGSNSSTSKPTEALKKDFIELLRNGDSHKFLTYVSAEGVNVGSEPRHETKDEVEQQIQHRRDLYCKLFDSSCLDAPVKLDASARTCSYRDALNRSKNAHIAATETVRNGVRQAILVAQPNAEQCPGNKLIDFIFNYEHGGWKLFSVP